jgi:hypothetical protein
MLEEMVRMQVVTNLAVPQLRLVAYQQVGDWQSEQRLKDSVPENKQRQKKSNVGIISFISMTDNLRLGQTNPKKMVYQ